MWSVDSTHVLLLLLLCCHDIRCKQTDRQTDTYLHAVFLPGLPHHVIDGLTAVLTHTRDRKAGTRLCLSA